MAHQLFVRWDLEKVGTTKELTLHDGYDTVELVDSGGRIFMSHTFCHNRDRVYGFCMGVVEALRLKGEDIEMPRCLEGKGARERHLTPDTSRQD